MNVFATLRGRYVRTVDRIVDDYCSRYGTRIAFGAFAFVFGYYGFLKLQALATGLTTPVRGEVGHFVDVLGLPGLGVSLTMVMVSIGLYEFALGLLFAFRKIRLAFPLFLGHQAVTFVSLVVTRHHYFQEPFVGGVPWLFDSFAAYILKNTIFVGGFLVLAAIELGDYTPEPATRSAGPDSETAPASASAGD